MATGIVSEYVKAAKAAKSAIAPFDGALRATILGTRDSIASMTAYSIVPIDGAHMRVASTVASVTHVAMPNVIARGDAGDALKGQARTAKLGVQGFGNLETEARIEAAKGALAKLLAAWPMAKAQAETTTKVSRKRPVARVATAAEVETATSAEVEAAQAPEVTIGA